MSKHWAVSNPGLADQYRAEALAARRTLGFSEDATDVAPVDIERRCAALNTPQAKKPVAAAETMPGASGLTIAVFDSREVPAGTALYTAPTASPDVCAECGGDGSGGAHEDDCSGAASLDVSGLVKFCEAKLHHLPVEDQHALTLILSAYWERQGEDNS